MLRWAVGGAADTQGRRGTRGTQGTPNPFPLFKVAITNISTSTKFRMTTWIRMREGSLERCQIITSGSFLAKRHSKRWTTPAPSNRSSWTESEHFSFLINVLDKYLFFCRNVIQNIEVFLSLGLKMEAFFTHNDVLRLVWISGGDDYPRVDLWTSLGYKSEQTYWHWNQTDTVCVCVCELMHVCDAPNVSPSLLTTPHSRWEQDMDHHRSPLRCRCSPSDNSSVQLDHRSFSHSLLRVTNMTIIQSTGRCCSFLIRESIRSAGAPRRRAVLHGGLGAEKTQSTCCCRTVSLGVRGQG